MPADQAPIQGAGSYQPNKRTIGELLSMTSPPIVVPDWQRNYRWSSSHVETFWNDLADFENRCGDPVTGEYFLGSIVIVETGNNSHLLLDGQQRLATSAILLSVIRDFLKRYRDDAALRVQSRYLADIDDARNVTVYKLSLNAYDRDFFRREILEYRDGGYVEPEPIHASHYLIKSARQFFEAIFEEKYEDLDAEAAFNWALRIQSVLMNHMTLISVTSTDEDSAAEVFETLNDRGIGLSTPDLLRNLVMRRAAENIRDDIVSLWGEIIEFETDSEIKLFLRHYWVSHFGDVKTQGLYREIKKHIYQNNVQSLPLSRSLADAASVYRDIKSARDDNPQIQELLLDVSEFGAGASILLPVILSIKQCVDLDAQARLLQGLINLYVRHSVIGQLENSRLENVIYRVARELRGNNDPGNALFAMAEYSPDDEATSASFMRLSLAHNGTRRYLLKKIEEDRRATEELGVNAPDKVHVEHIYPQTPRAGERLESHQNLVNRMGNLTLLSRRINTAIKNGTFAEKKPSYENSEILITRDLLAFEEWNARTIEQRQAQLSERISVIWPRAIE